MYNWFYHLDIPLEVWCGATVIALVTCVLGHVCPSLRWKPEGRASLRLASWAMVLPVFTLIQFTNVFLIAGSSNVVQEAGPDGREAWSSWLSTWPLFFFGNPVSILLAVWACCLTPRRINTAWTWLARGAVLITAICAYQIVVRLFPDA